MVLLEAMIPYRVYSDKSVLDAAKERIRWLFDEFKHVIVFTSGGKDSTVVFELALEAAKEKGRLPLSLLFLDQEIEWESTIDVVRHQMGRDGVKPYWMQIPFQLSNATSASEEWLYCWDPKKEPLWMRPKEACSVKENTFGSVRFADLLTKIPIALFSGEPVAVLGGVRCHESPGRTLGLTSYATWKWATWGARRGKNCYTFYPIYDWSVSDVWKAIHSHGWKYSRLYDAYYQHGKPVSEMRVSNFHHELAVQNMWIVQEVEPETYNRAVARLAGLDSCAKFGADDYFPSTLPDAFGSWKEYRDYLLENLIARADWRSVMGKRFAKQDASLFELLGDRLHKVHVRSILANDWEGVKLANLVAETPMRKYDRRRKTTEATARKR